MQTSNQEYHYWLFGWLEYRRITTIQDLRRVLGDQSCLSELREVAEAWWGAERKLSSPGVNLVAGTGLRLDDLMTCPNFPCRRQQVDVLFRHAWHYFDSILLPDAVGRLLINPPKTWERDFFLDTIFNWIALVMYIRDLGATDLVRFYPKTWKSSANLQELFPSKNSRVLNKAIREVETALVEQGKYTFEQIDSSTVHVEFLDTILGVITSIDLHPPKKRKVSENRLRTVTAHSVVNEHLENLADDIHSRNQLNGALGSIVWSHERILSRLAAPSARDIAMRLVLPSLSDIPVNELIAVRIAEAESFKAFRSALTKAAQEILNKDPAPSLQNAADKIITEIVNPELTKLQQRLRTAERALARKTAISVALAGLTTTCGLFLGVGPGVAGLAGVGAMASSAGTAAAKYIEEKQTIEMSDMYFLWKALGHAKQ